MDSTSRGWKLLNLAIGISEENNEREMLAETPNVEFVLELGDGKSM